VFEANTPLDGVAMLALLVATPRKEINLPVPKSDIGQICPAVLVFALTPYCSPTVRVAPKLITPEVKSLTG
jgi:hypothetical protein